MANTILAYGNRIDDATLFGGSWLATLPLTNLQDRRLGKVARSSAAGLADTKFDVDLGGVRLTRVVALVNHNFSVDALYRIRLSSVSDFSTTVADSGWTDVWPRVYPSGSVPWGSPSWWSGRYAAEDIAGYTATLVYLLPATKNARYIRIEIDDTANEAGYVQIGRVFTSDGWQPVRNMTYGGSGLGWEDPSGVQKSLSGAASFDEKNKLRVARFGLAAMTEGEAMGNAFEIQRFAGITKEVLFVWDPDDTEHAIRRQFLGRMRTLSLMENPGPDRWKAPFEIEELL